MGDSEDESWDGSVRSSISSSSLPPIGNMNRGSQGEYPHDTGATDYEWQKNKQRMRKDSKFDDRKLSVASAGSDMPVHRSRRAEAHSSRPNIIGITEESESASEKTENPSHLLSEADRAKKEVKKCIVRDIVLFSPHSPPADHFPTRPSSTTAVPSRCA